MERTQKWKKAARIFTYLLPAASLFGTFLRVPFAPSVNFFNAVLALIGFCVLASCFCRRDARLPLGHAAPYAAVLVWMIFYAALSLLWAQYPVYARGIFEYQAQGIAVILCMTATLKKRDHLLRFLDVLILCYAAAVGFGIEEIFTGYFLFSPSNYELYLRNAYGLFFPYVAFDNTNDYATYILLFFPFAAYGLTQRFPGFRGGILATVLFAGAMLTMFNADPRILYFAIGLAAVLFFAAMAAKPCVRRSVRHLIAVAGAGVGAIALFGCTMLIKASVFTSEIKSVNMDNHSVSERVMLTFGALRMIPASHFLGVGAGNAAMLMDYFSNSIKAFNVHNMTLQILAEYGVLVWVPYVLMLVFLAVRFWNFRAGGYREQSLAGICFAMVCAFPIVGIASADMTHILAVWPALGLFLVCLNVLYPCRRPETGAGAKKLLFISFIDFGDFSSGSSVRPQRMAEAFEKLGFEVTVLSGLQNRRRERWHRVMRVFRSVRLSPPDLCYVEPPSGPFFNLCDHLLLFRLWANGVPIGLFYRDAYWKFADWWQVKGLKRAVITAMQRFDLLVFRLTCKVIFFPTARMAGLFSLPRKAVLPPAGVFAPTPAHEPSNKAIYVGGVSYFYGTDMLLDAFAFLNEEMGKNIHLTVVCRQNEMGGFFEPYLGRPWLTVMHRSGAAALAPLYARSDVALYPSRPDRYMDFCMPVKLFDYLSHALPVVCTDCAEAAAFVRENGVGVVTPYDAKAFARAVAALFEHPDKLRALREQCVTVLRERHLWRYRAVSAAETLLETRLPARYAELPERNG